MKKELLMAGLIELLEHNICEECFVNTVGTDEKICEGCLAYRDHTGQF